MKPEDWLLVGIGAVVVLSLSAALAGVLAIVWLVLT